MWGKCGLSDFYHGMVIGARSAGLSISGSTQKDVTKTTLMFCELNCNVNKFLDKVRGKWPD